MSFTLATWNINSVRLREGLVARLMTEEQPDILCLQEATDVFKFNDLTGQNVQKYCSKILVLMVDLSKIAQNWRHPWDDEHKCSVLVSAYYRKGYDWSLKAV